MTLPDPPPNWGHDEISKLIDIARVNEYATFANFKGEVNRLVDIDLSYRKVIDGLNHAKDWFAGFFERARVRPILYMSFAIRINLSSGKLKA